MINWEPDRLPDQLLPPNVDPIITLDEIINSGPEEYAKLYYMRSGRYLGVYPDRAAADAADPYCFVRKFLGGRPLPWEK